jgi:hypothetical protein
MQQSYNNRNGKYVLLYYILHPEKNNIHNIYVMSFSLSKILSSMSSSIVLAEVEILCGRYDPGKLALMRLQRKWNIFAVVFLAQRPMSHQLS